MPNVSPAAHCRASDKRFAQRSNLEGPRCPPPPHLCPTQRRGHDVQTRIVLFLLTYPAMSISDPCEDDEPATQPRQNGTGTLRSPREATSALNPSRPERLLIILSFRSSSCWLCSSGGIPLCNRASASPHGSHSGSLSLKAVRPLCPRSPPLTPQPPGAASPRSC